MVFEVSVADKDSVWRLWKVPTGDSTTEALEILKQDPALI
jgi:hypothetical protein